MTANQILQASGAFLAYIESLNPTSPKEVISALETIYAAQVQEDIKGTDALTECVNVLETWTWPGSNPPALLAPADKITVLQCVAWLYGAAS